MTYAPNTFNILDEVNFTVIKDDRFKTGRISVSIFFPLDKSTASVNAILPFLLIRSCKKYPDFTSIQEKLSDLYGVTLSADIEKIGESQVSSITATFLDDQYALNSERISKEVAELLCEIIFKPNITDNKFFESDVEQEKRQLIEMICSEYNDKKVYAKQRCISNMCQDEKFGVNPLGTQDGVERLTGTEIYDAWNNMLKQARFEIIMIGNSDHEPVFDGFKEAFSKISNRQTLDCTAEFVPEAKGIKEIVEEDAVSQCKLVLGFRIGATSVDDNVMATRVMNALFGATPHSKLFLNVREKLSLCYYCSSNYDRNKGILTVECGVERKNIESAKNEILKQLDEIRKGNFDDEDVRTTKLSLCNSFRTVSDYLGGLENFYLSQVFSKELITPEESTRRVNNVTRDQIISIAQKLTLDTVYSLTNKE